MSESMWPTLDMYDCAMLNRANTVEDPDIRSGCLHEKNGRPFHYGNNGNKRLPSRLYRVGNWMVRCFAGVTQSDQREDTRVRYMAIEQFCREQLECLSAISQATADYSPLLPITYLENGITVEGFSEKMPLVKMPYLAAPSLGEYVDQHHDEPDVIKRVLSAWRFLISKLISMGMAHGDLDVTNVKVIEQGSHVILKLIDYTNFWIPALRKLPQNEFGHDNFQHPAFFSPNDRPYNATMDYFSALVIYISLQAIIICPRLYTELGGDGEHKLLFERGDYEVERLSGTGVIDRLSKELPTLTHHIGELRASLRDERMPESLDALEVISRVPRFIDEKTTYRLSGVPRKKEIDVEPDGYPQFVPVLNKGRQLAIRRILVISLLVVSTLILLMLTFLFLTMHH